MKHYTVNEFLNIVFVPINYIKFDRSMLKMLNRHNIDYKTDNVNSTWCGNLSCKRLQSILEGIKAGICIPPIQVELIKGHPEKMSYVPEFLLKRGIKPKKIKAKNDSYSIINGRHRVVASVISKNTHIPVIIENIL